MNDRRAFRAVRLCLAGAYVSVVSLIVAASASAAAPTPSAPVNLSTPVDFAIARAVPPAIVRAGDARFEILGSGLVRLEYAPGARFTDGPSVNVVRRRFAAPRFTVTRRSGWLSIRTSLLTLHYRLGAGAFTPASLKVETHDGIPSSPFSPRWIAACAFGQVCDAGSASLAGGAALASAHSGYASTAGYIAGLAADSPAAATWTVLGAPRGSALIRRRFANAAGPLGGPAPRTITVSVDGGPPRRLVVPATGSWNHWSVLTLHTSLRAGANTVAVSCAQAACTVNLDTLTAFSPGRTPPALPASRQLGGYIRGFDHTTYAHGYRCERNRPPDSCTAALPSLHPGLLDRSGYHLLDDSQSALWTATGWVAARPALGRVQDGYLFVYGHDYLRALHQLAELVGPAPLPPRSLFGVWFSDDFPYFASDYENTIVPRLRAAGIPLGALSLDTDWKAPVRWDGWDWNTGFFPDPQGFLAWASGQGISVALNLHPSIATTDPQWPAAQALADRSLLDPSCGCGTWDWSDVAQAQSYFALQRPLEAQGVNFWWLDWCCDDSRVTLPGLDPDDWINHLQAQELANRGERGFVLSRLGASRQAPDGAPSAGPWSARTSTLQFTGDAWGTWNTLAFESELAADTATIGEPYVSDDIGSFLGPPPGQAIDPPDLYVRWVQLGAFQPILRLHADHGERLPWQYPSPAARTAAAFLRLRAALVPYTYTLAADSARDGAPITRPLYLDYPGLAAAYRASGEYLYGPDLLVAPVTRPGAVATVHVWFPPGRWSDWFTGTEYAGPALRALRMPLDRMPVFVRAGAIIPEQVPSGGTLLRVDPGASGRTGVYEDAGTGSGYLRGESSRTPVQLTPGPGSLALTIGAARGRYPGQPAARQFTIEITHLSRPGVVRLDGRRLAHGWHYSRLARTLTVTLPPLALRASATLTLAAEPTG
jgi:hypothetical protein